MAELLGVGLSSPCSRHPLPGIRTDSLSSLTYSPHFLAGGGAEGGAAGRAPTFLRGGLIPSSAYPGSGLFPAGLSLLIKRSLIAGLRWLRRCLGWSRWTPTGRFLRAVASAWLTRRRRYTSFLVHDSPLLTGGLRRRRWWRGRPHVRWCGRAHIHPLVTDPMYHLYRLLIAICSHSISPNPETRPNKHRC